MPLPTSGPLSLTDIQTEFGGTNPISLNEYYAGGGLVPSGTTGTNGAVPSSGAISINSFYGTSNVRYFSNAFSQRIGSTYRGVASAVELDVNGNVWTYGQYAFESGGVADSLSNMYITKANAGNGSISFQQSLSSTAYDLRDGQGMTSDSSGNLYISFRPGGVSGLVIVKYDSSFSVQWDSLDTNVQASSIPELNGFKVANASGNVYIAGQDVSTFTKGIIDKISHPNILWERTIVTGSSPSYSVTGIELDSSENVYATGWGYNTSTGASYTSFIIKYNSSGTLQWQRRLTPPSGTELTMADVTLSSSDDVYIVGKLFAVSIQRGFLYVAKYNSSGVVQWQIQIADSASGNWSFDPYNIVTDSDGNIYVMARRTTATLSPATTVVLIKLNSSGSILWQRELRITIPPATTGQVNFPGKLKIASNGDLFLAMSYTIAQSGITQPIGWTIKLPSDGSKTGTSVITATTAAGFIGTLNYTATTFTSSTPTLTEAAGAYTFASPTPVSLAPATVTNTAIPLGTEVNVNSTNTIV
jgi:hypothetical protein